MTRHRTLVVFTMIVQLLYARDVLAQGESDEKLVVTLYNVFPAPDAASRAFIGGISNQLTSFPLGSSAGGFSWTFDTSTGAFLRASPSFGPLFAERALTVGRGRLNVGFNYQRSTYDEFDRQSLQDGDLSFVFRGAPLPAGGAVTFQLNLKLNVDSGGFFANYGLTDRVDLGVAVPLLHVSAKFTSTNRLFTNGQQALEEVNTDSASASGLGDVVVRGKFKILDRPGGGVAVGVDVRLPTGDEEDLLGIPGTQAKLFGIYSMTVGRVAPHANIGFAVSSSNGKTSSPEAVLFQNTDPDTPLDPNYLLRVPNEFSYAAGADIAVHPRVTLVGDVVGRVLGDVFKLQSTTVPIGGGVQANTLGVNPDLINLNLVLASVGVKFNVVSNLLVSANVLVPITKGGLRDKFTPVFGVDWSF